MRLNNLDLLMIKYVNIFQCLTLYHCVLFYYIFKPYDYYKQTGKKSATAFIRLSGGFPLGYAGIIFNLKLL